MVKTILSSSTQATACKSFIKILIKTSIKTPVTTKLLFYIYIGSIIFILYRGRKFLKKSSSTQVLELHYILLCEYFHKQHRFVQFVQLDLDYLYKPIQVAQRFLIKCKLFYTSIYIWRYRLQ